MCCGEGGWRNRLRPLQGFGRFDSRASPSRLFLVCLFPSFFQLRSSFSFLFLPLLPKFLSPLLSLIQRLLSVSPRGSATVVGAHVMPAMPICQNPGLDVSIRADIFDGSREAETWWSWVDHALENSHRIASLVVVRELLVRHEAQGRSICTNPRLARGASGASPHDSTWKCSSAPPTPCVSRGQCDLSVRVSSDGREIA